MTSIIIDTGFLYALFYKNDENHIKAKKAALQYNEFQWLTTCFVFQELYWLLNKNNPLQLFEAEKCGIFQVVDFEKSQFSEIEKIAQKYVDREIDLADASLISLAEELGHGNILTTDVKDFSVYRWNRTNAFNLLLV